MKSLLRRLFRSVSLRKKLWAERLARPEVECLEAREVPTVTRHTGTVLAYPEVQALYLGANWWPGSAYYGQTGYLDGYLKYLVNSPYVDMLSNEGYGIQRNVFGHSFDGGSVYGANLGATVTDTQIQQYLRQLFGSSLKSPDSSRLYVVFVDPNAAVSRGGKVSNPAPGVNGFFGYHDSFAFNGQKVPYAVIAYPGGPRNNAQVSWLTALPQLTLITSHEFAEAVTNPYTSLGTLGWNDDSPVGGGEVGDITNLQTVYLNGYAVQRIADTNDQAMTPAGAAAQDQKSFVLSNDGSLNFYYYNNPTPTYLGSGIASVSEQSIDNQGRATVDVILTSGAAYEIHLGQGWVFLGNGVKSAVYGQGVSYVLFNNGTLKEYINPLSISQSGTWKALDWNRTDITAIDAGTDKYGVNMVLEISSWGGVFKKSDGLIWEFLGDRYKAMSAGQQGIIGLVDTGGNAWCYKESTYQTLWVASNVTAISAGTATDGRYVIDVVFADGGLSAAGWNESNGLGRSFAVNVKSMSKSRNGYINTASFANNAWLFDPSASATWLTGNARSAV